jgi:hypothetical protein
MLKQRNIPICPRYSENRVCCPHNIGKKSVYEGLITWGKTSWVS